VPITYTVDRERGRIVATADGRVDHPTILDHIEQLRAEGILDLTELVDATRATADITAEDIRGIVTRLQTLGSQYALGPAAIVTAHDVTFGMLRMLGMLVEPFCDVQPFRTPGEAETWLGSIPGPRPPHWGK
jgi:hypothetical protein